MTEFQKRLRDAMADAKMNATELSEKSGVDKSSISNYLKGKYFPKQDKMYEMAKALNVDPGWLSTGDGNQTMSFELPSRPLHPSVMEMLAENNTTKESRIISRGVSRLPVEEQRRILNIIRLSLDGYKDYFADEDEGSKDE